MRSLPELREHCLPFTHFILATLLFKVSFLLDWDILPICATVLIFFTAPIDCWLQNTISVLGQRYTQMPSHLALDDQRDLIMIFPGFSLRRPHPRI